MWKISYKLPNPLFIIWLIICGFFIAFFYYCGINLIQAAHQVLLGYMAYGIGAGFFLLAILPYLLGLEITYIPKPKTAEQIAKEQEEQAKEAALSASLPPVGNDYFIPIFGWLKYQLPNLLRKKRYIIIIENTSLYFLVGIFNGIYHYPFTPLYAFALIIAIIVEYWAYYKSWLPTMATPNGVNKKQVAIAYLTIQEHAFGFLGLGWLVGLYFL